MAQLPRASPCLKCWYWHVEEVGLQCSYALGCVYVFFYLRMCASVLVETRSMQDFLGLLMSVRRFGSMVDVCD